MATVFVSHRRSDALEAEALANDIRSAGHQVWLDDWEIGLGDSIVAKMNEGLEGAAYLVLCYSKAGSEAPWMGREWQSALARQSMTGTDQVPAWPLLDPDHRALPGLGQDIAVAVNNSVGS